MFWWKTLFESSKSYKIKIRAMLGMPNPRSLKGQPSESGVSPRLIFFAVIYPCTSNAHESEIIPHDLTLLRKSPDVITTAMVNLLYGRTSAVPTISLSNCRILASRMMLWVLSTTSQSSKTLSYCSGIFFISHSNHSDTEGTNITMPCATNMGFRNIDP